MKSSQKQYSLAPKHTLLNQVAVSFVVVTVVLLLVVTELFAGIRDGVLRGTAPVRNIATSVVSVATLPFKVFFSGVEKQERLLQLSNQVSQMEARIAALEYVEQENKALRELLENSDRTLDQTYITTPIVSLSYPAIAAGSADGMTVGRAVVLSGTVVGMISDVSMHQSQVTLLSSTHLKPLLVRTESGVEAIIQGDGRSVLMRHIPREVTLVEGERVFTKGQEGIRKNMFVGRVGRVSADPSAPTQEATIEQYVSFFDATLVEVW